MSKKTVLVTGGAGFIGSAFVRMVMETRPDLSLINLDALTYSGNLENLEAVAGHSRYEFVRGDIRDLDIVSRLMQRCEAVVHFAAESHVDRSIQDSAPFVTTNVHGTQVLLDAARRCEIEKFVHVSTDEVYGSLPLDDREATFREDSPIRPNSPYAASKASSDLFVGAYFKTFGLPVCITRCSNNFGPYQFPEKIIPLFVTNLMQGEKVPLYGDGLHVRDWLHVDDHCEALLRVLDDGEAGQIYNIGGNNEHSNLGLTHSILEILGVGEEMIRPVEDRLGHDRRYAIDASKILDDLGWEPTRSRWPEALEQTVRWYQDHEKWWKRVRSGAYRKYYEEQYGR